MSFLTSCTDEEKEAMEELKRRTFHELTPSILQDETVFYRFLKARDFNLKNAETMLRNHLSDRKFYEVEKIMKSYTPPQNIASYFTNSFLGYDKEGCFVGYMDGGSDFKGVAHMFQLKQVLQFSMEYLERKFDEMAERSKTQGKLQTQHTVIFNMEKSSLSQISNRKSVDFIIESTTIYQNNYPERMKAIYIINAPKYFSIFFPLIKTALASALLDKIQIFGATGWQSALLEVIDADVLPAFLGGNRTDPDGNLMCNSFIDHAKKVPEELYRKKNRIPMNLQNGVRTLNISRSLSAEIEIVVSVPSTEIEWEFETKKNDIVFALYFRKHVSKDSKLEELIPKHKFCTELGPETGQYTCEKIGTYIIVFDNSDSWLYSKEVYYRVNLILPQKKKTMNY